MKKIGIILIVFFIISFVIYKNIPRLDGGIQKTPDSERIRDISTLQTAMTVYFDDYGEYPQSSGECLTPESEVTKKIIIYLKNIPFDPKKREKGLCIGGKSIFPWRKTYDYYWYKSLSDGNHGSFIVCANVKTYQKANINLNDRDKFNTYNETKSLLEASESIDTPLQFKSLPEESLGYCKIEER